MRKAGHVACMRKRINMLKNVTRKPERKRSFSLSKFRQENIVKVDLKRIEFESID
jgi:hypothetical protein